MFYVIMFNIVRMYIIGGGKEINKNKNIKQCGFRKI